MQSMYGVTNYFFSVVVKTLIWTLVLVATIVPDCISKSDWLFFVTDCIVNHGRHRSLLLLVTECI